MESNSNVKAMFVEEYGGEIMDLSLSENDQCHKLWILVSQRDDINQLSHCKTRKEFYKRQEEKREFYKRRERRIQAREFVEEYEWELMKLLRGEENVFEF